MRFRLVTHLSHAREIVRVVPFKAITDSVAACRLLFGYQSPRFTIRLQRAIELGEDARSQDLQQQTLTLRHWGEKGKIHMETPTLWITELQQLAPVIGLTAL